MNCNSKKEMNDIEIRIIIAGSRDYSDYEELCKVTDKILQTYVFSKGIFKKSDIVIVCGMARGADLLGKRYAESKGYNVKFFHANWDLYGKSAGYIRNEEMAKYASYRNGYGALIAFWDGKSRGTKHMIDLAKKYNLKVFLPIK